MTFLNLKSNYYLLIIVLIRFEVITSFDYISIILKNKKKTQKKIKKFIFLFFLFILYM